MPKRQRHREIPAEHRAAEHLANERTFLAWVRTNIALISLGFVLARLGPWLHDSGVNTPRLASKAWPLGIGLVKTDRLLVWFVAVATTSIFEH
jgi:putative membrane protein